ncbi:ModD protein [Paenalcaligenes hominis]|uniref:ModD protein n=1 Tax=Paenalcaligenes hominis TaxID=643674 RepID=UPI003525A23B
MMNSVFFDHATIDRWINEDAPFLDLTSHMLGIGAADAYIEFTIRHEGVAACTEEVNRILTHCGAQSIESKASGTQVQASEVLLRGHGPAHAVLRAWKVGQNLLEYSCGVARQAARMYQKIQQHDPSMALLTTRKHAPGLRALALKSTICAGALPHRLGLSETVLVFPQHIALLGGWEALKKQLVTQKAGFAEKKVVIEAQNQEEALLAIEAGADVVQFDKATPAELQAWLPALRQQWPQGVFLAAGGIKLDNIEGYAQTGVDALVTSALHYAPPADIGVHIYPDA